MSSNTDKMKLREFLLLAALFLMALAFIFIAAIPQLRNSVKEAFSSSHRQVLAKITGTLSADGPKLTILKIKSGDSINLEIFKHGEDDSLEPFAKIPLFNAKDAYLEVQGNATNLSLTDIDKNGVMEIVAPTYDDQMVPRLNIFEYNPNSNSFDRMNAPDNYVP